MTEDLMQWLVIFLLLTLLMSHPAHLILCQVLLNITDRNQCFMNSSPMVNLPMLQKRTILVIPIQNVWDLQYSTMIMMVILIFFRQMITNSTFCSEMIMGLIRKLQLRAEWQRIARVKVPVRCMPPLAILMETG